jgi:hypothetical protein
LGRPVALSRRQSIRAPRTPERALPLDSDGHASRPWRRPGHPAVVSRQGAAGTVVESSRTCCRGANSEGCGRQRGTTSRAAPRGVAVVSFCRGRRRVFAAQRAARHSSLGGVPPAAEVGLRKRFMPPRSRENERSRRPAGARTTTAEPRARPCPWLLASRSAGAPRPRDGAEIGPRRWA